MVYLAILLILCGLLILITALFIETGKVDFTGEIKKSSGSQSGKSSCAESHSSDFESEEIEIIFPGDRIDKIKNNIDQEDVFLSFDDESPDLNESAHIPLNEDRKFDSPAYKNTQRKEEASGVERRSISSAGRPSVIEKRESVSLGNDDASVSAIMFDDRSNIIDYESGTGVIDSTFSKYKSIKRIGKGKIESDYDGVNFYLDEKLYRFDFHKVYDIWSGSNYIALPLKGNSTVKLFIIENSAGFTDKVEANFKEYEKGL